jgi:hypothetical protein
MAILASWKEIAAYLKHGTGTVQRWESLGLPVHRPKGGRRTHVIALTEELDAWVATTPTRRDEQIATLEARVGDLEAEVAFLRTKQRAATQAS